MSLAQGYLRGTVSVHSSRATHIWGRSIRLSASRRPMSLYQGIPTSGFPDQFCAPDCLRYAQCGNRSYLGLGGLDAFAGPSSFQSGQCCMWMTGIWISQSISRYRKLAHINTRVSWSVPRSASACRHTRPVDQLVLAHCFPFHMEGVMPSQ
jgi:hypothetical protein